jgi:hypothetical protein
MMFLDRACHGQVTKQELIEEMKYGNDDRGNEGWHKKRG